MNYKESSIILEEIKKAKRILVNCHRGPDPDSIGSALAMYRVIKNMGKKADVICPSNELFDNVSYLEDYKNIRKGVDFSMYDFTKFDLFIILDSASWDMVAGGKNINIPKIKMIVIDHHLTNTKFGNINLVDDKATSVGELLYRILRDVGINIDSAIANYLMVSIIGDTGAFRFPGSTEETFAAAAQLIKLGADKDRIIHHLYRSEPLNLIKFYGEVLTNIKLDEKGKFVWVAIPYETYKKLDKPTSARESAASLFAQVIEGTDFGFLAVEEEPKILSVSFRSRTGFNTSKIALELGGGGHVYASGAKIRGLAFDLAVEKLLQSVNKYARE